MNTRCLKQQSHSEYVCWGTGSLMYDICRSCSYCASPYIIAMTAWHTTWMIRKPWIFRFVNTYRSAVKRRSTLGGLDQYTTPNTKLNTLEMSAPPPPQRKNNKKLFIVAMSCKVSNTTNTCTNKNCHTVALSQWNSLRSTHPTNWVWRVTWQLAHFLSDVTGSSTVKSVTIFRYRSFVMCIRTAIYGSFPVLFSIDIQNPHHCWNVVYRQHRLNITFQSVSCILHAEWAILGADVPWTCPTAPP